MGALLGWGLLWGIAVLGRLMFQKDAMGHGDIKMMRGVGALLGPGLLAISLGLAVVSGLVIGLILIGIETRMRKKAAADTPEAAEEPREDDKEPLGSLFGWGASYLLCVDVFATLIPPLGKWIESKLPEGQGEDAEDDWEPSLTTIPFGPYLAIGSIVCMLFGGPLLGMVDSYWRNATEPAPKISTLGSISVEHSEPNRLRSRWPDVVEPTVFNQR
jgi:leader peptidase (prepilin peptidase)/N-methyltransferase